jgi:hypothetical protein
LYKYEDIIQSGIGSAETFLTQSDEIGIDVISNQCGALVTPIIEGVGLVKDNLGILLGGEYNLTRQTLEVWLALTKRSYVI